MEVGRVTSVPSHHPGSRRNYMPLLLLSQTRPRDVANVASSPSLSVWGRRCHLNVGFVCTTQLVVEVGWCIFAAHSEDISLVLQSGLSLALTVGSRCLLAYETRWIMPRQSPLQLFRVMAFSRPERNRQVSVLYPKDWRQAPFCTNGRCLSGLLPKAPTSPFCLDLPSKVEKTGTVSHSFCLVFFCL